MCEIKVGNDMWIICNVKVNTGGFVCSQRQLKELKEDINVLVLKISYLKTTPDCVVGWMIPAL